MEIRQARKSSVSMMPVFFCGVGGTHTRGEAEVAGGSQSTGSRKWGSGEGWRRGEKSPRGGGREQRGANVRPQDAERRGEGKARRRVPRKDHRGPRSKQQAEKPDRAETAEGAPGKEETGRWRQREEKGETLGYSSARTPPLSVLHAGGEYLGVVANIITQADEAGFELLGTQRAGVILGPPCQAASHAMPGRWRP